MAELTVGYVAGIIALGIFILICPNILAFIAASLLKEDESAATWTIVTPLLQSSLWTQILQTDTAKTKGVDWKILTSALLTTAMAGLIGIAAVVTPLGLFDEIVSENQITPEFQYAPDSSPYGVSTPPRSNYSWSRTCSVGHGFTQGPAPCPYSDTSIYHSANSSSIYFEFDDYNVSVPQVLLDIYSSGTRHLTTVSNYFDIQWRLYNLATDEDKNNGSAFLINDFRHVQSIALDNSVHAVEGLVVDTRSGGTRPGGIGFRNHTLPIVADSTHGVTWSEDLLFIEPESVCVNTNITIDYTLSPTHEALDDPFSEIALVDHGGFVDLNHTYPMYGRDNAQQDPALYARAYKAAWLNNIYMMLFMNVTNPNNEMGYNKSFSYMNSERGKRFQLPTNISILNLGYFSLTSSFGSSIVSAGDFDPTFNSSSNSNLFPNPFHITSDNFSSISAGNADIANITNIFVACGLMYGPPNRTDGGSEYRPTEYGSKWSTPLYACSSAIKATIRTVTFRLNGTTLADLDVLDSQPKNYSSETHMPLWGVEDSGLAMDGISPIWGIVDSSFENYPNVSTVRQPHLYLPGYYNDFLGGLSIGSGYQYLPGSDFGPQTMTTVYAGSTSDATGVYSDGTVNDYSGSRNMAMFIKWQQFSRTADQAGNIPNLIWTDLAASAVVGTKGVLGSNNDGSQQVSVSVGPMVRRVRFHIMYAVPAFIVIVFLIVIFLIAIASMVFGRAGPTVVRRRLHQTSTGRIFTTILHPDRSDLAMGSKEWSKANASSRINLDEGLIRKTGRVSDDLYSPVNENLLLPEDRQRRTNYR